MTKEKFNEIIDFAVGREEEAVAFYQDLQGKAKFSAQVEMLREFENMERGHIVILENIRRKGYEGIKEKHVPDLKISDYIVSIEPSPGMTYQDILIMAMKREEKAHNLYNNMAGRFPGTDLEKLFHKLASEEAKHKLHFEKLYDEEVLRDN
ncbi:MAG: ferritin family protein [Candidatus Cloacimonetes bacterium]|nr:ferritin family protein [Candidatus Cloacimonadota bacterium]